MNFKLFQRQLHNELYFREWHLLTYIIIKLRINRDTYIYDKTNPGEVRKFTLPVTLKLNNSDTVVVVNFKMKCVNHQVTLFVLFISQSICYALGYAPIINHSLVKLKPTTTIIPRLISSSRFSLMNDEHHSEIEPIDLMHSDDSGSNIVISTSMAIGSFIMMSSIIVTDPTVANALVDSVANPPFIDPAVASAIIAYGHYLSLILMVASVLTERILIKADMTVKDEEKVIIADSIYGIAGVLGLVTG